MPLAVFQDRPTQKPLLSIVRYGLELDRVTETAGPKPRSIWVAGSILAGLGFGIVATVFLGASQTERKPAVVQQLTRIEDQKMTQTVVPVTYSLDNSSKTSLASVKNHKADADLEEVKTRNRRLEALVKVLRRRDASERLTTVSRKN